MENRLPVVGLGVEHFLSASVFEDASDEDYACPECHAKNCEGRGLVFEGLAHFGHPQVFCDERLRDVVGPQM